MSSYFEQIRREFYSTSQKILQSFSFPYPLLIRMQHPNPFITILKPIRTSWYVVEIIVKPDYPSMKARFVVSVGIVLLTLTLFASWTSESFAPARPRLKKVRNVMSHTSEVYYRTDGRVNFVITQQFQRDTFKYEYDGPGGSQKVLALISKLFK